MKIKILSYSNKKFNIEDIDSGIEFKIPEKTLIKLLKLNPDVLRPALVGRNYLVTSESVEI